jgi:predicted amidohydrolase YtcJ
VLSNNLLEIKPQEIAKVTVLRTIVGGRQVYAAP